MAITDIVPGYDGSAKYWAETALERWGKREENLMSMVRFGLSHLDRALYGIDVDNGELVMIQAPEKARKTTTVMNIVMNYMTADLPLEKPITIMDTLESGSPPDKVADKFIVMLAAEYIMARGHTQADYCVACDNPDCKHLSMNVKWLRYQVRNPLQKEAIDFAREEFSKWPLTIYGAPIDMGNTRDLYWASGMGADGRWYRLMKERGAKIFISDHLQQYAFLDGTQSDYEKQIRAVDSLGAFVATHKAVVFALSQISLTSIREANSGSGKWTASGGRKAAQEAVSILSTHYDSKENPSEVKVRIEDSREAPQITFFNKVDPFSGRFYGDTYDKEGRAF